jgi:hypothetical protein
VSLLQRLPARTWRRPRRVRELLRAGPTGASTAGHAHLHSGADQVAL